MGPPTLLDRLREAIDSTLADHRRTVISEPANNRHDALERALGPTSFEVTCEQCFGLLDQFVDLELAGADADRELPGVGAHLDGCPACREDHESLVALVRSDQETPS